MTGQSSAAYLGEMPRRGAKTEPDLFTLPERKTRPAPLPSFRRNAFTGGGPAGRWSDGERETVAQWLQHRFP